jgi:alkanesulfonate monooxygenase
MGIDELARKLDILKGHCKAVGRSYNDIERTALGQVNLGSGGMSPEELIEFCRSLADIGIQQFIFSVVNTQDIEPLEIIGREVIPVVAEF